ncbi:hypothetical protein FSARC_9622 [Fusarium sarcochroum]|uniref:Uncharacterized protein n=1 Tax=Fusarium sarcochroum TaxID=1208366 RepID=A0A8H4TQN3_9HYPO|nr:hypothetical protein FSARC_9622 [Fusarium sarcochroum]
MHELFEKHTEMVRLCVLILVLCGVQITAGHQPKSDILLKQRLNYIIGLSEVSDKSRLTSASGQSDTCLAVQLLVHPEDIPIIFRDMCKLPQYALSAVVEAISLYVSCQFGVSEDICLTITDLRAPSVVLGRKNQNPCAEQFWALAIHSAYLNLIEGARAEHTERLCEMALRHSAWYLDHESDYTVEAQCRLLSHLERRLGTDHQCTLGLVVEISANLRSIGRMGDSVELLKKSSAKARERFGHSSAAALEHQIELLETHVCLGHDVVKSLHKILILSMNNGHVAVAVRAGFLLGGQLIDRKRPNAAREYYRWALLKAKTLELTEYIEEIRHGAAYAIKEMLEMEFQHSE